MTQLCSTASKHEASWKMQLFKVFCVFCLTAVCAAQDSENVTFTHTNFTTPAVVTATDDIPVLQALTAWLDVFPGESVKFSCRIEGSSDWTFSWYLDDVELRDSASLSGDGSVLTIPAVHGTHAGNYSCNGHKKNGEFSERSDDLQLVVYDKITKPTVSKTPDFNPMYIGETVSLTCTVSVATGWKYQWYRDGQMLSHTGNIFNLALQLSDKGKYSCKATRGEIQVTSDPTPLDVLAVPTPTLEVRSPWKSVFIGEQVKFMCQVDIPDWTFTWYKNQASLEEASVQHESTKTITATKTAAGSYSCKAHLPSRGLSSGYSNTAEITVYDQTPKPTVTKAPTFNPMYVGESVIITCTVSEATDWKYQWYRDGQMLSHTGNVFNPTLQLSDKGKYSCKATRGETTETDLSDPTPLDVLEIPAATLEKVTQWLDVFPTETVKFRCHIQTSSGWTYEWLKDSQKIQPDDTVESNGAILSISSASAKHRGQYECKGHLPDRGVNSKASAPLTLEVYDKKPAVTVTQTPDYKVMFPGEFVNFSCHTGVSSGWEYKWIKDGGELTAYKDHSIKTVQTTDKGSYRCQIKRGSNPSFGVLSTVIKLEVKGEKPKPSLIQKPGAEKLFAGESVVFECKVEISTGWSYQWYKDGHLFHDGSSSFKKDSAALSDSGKYECQATRAPTMFHTERSDARSLTISEIPVPTLKAETQWLDVFPTESAQLRCGMPTSSDWRYTWFRDAQEIQRGETVSFDADATTLTISSASAAHRGSYSCSAQLKSRSVNSSTSSGLTLSVYDTKPTVTLKQDPEYSLMHTGDSVSFSCHINVSSGWAYRWFKDGILFTESGNNHTISSVQTSSKGTYKCQVERGINRAFKSDQSQAVELKVEERPQAGIILLTGWSEVFSTDSLKLRCEVARSEDNWNYTWYKANVQIVQSTSDKHIVTPQDDPDQSLYTCMGVRSGRPSYSKTSEPFRTKNLLLKRRVLLSISGCIFFGIIAVFIGCIVLRVTRKPADDDMKPEEENLFLSMAQQKGCDVPSPLVEYITDANLKGPEEGGENGTVCSDATPLPITTQDDQAVKTDDQDAAENNGLVSFKQ